MLSKRLNLFKKKTSHIQNLSLFCNTLKKEYLQRLTQNQIIGTFPKSIEHHTKENRKSLVDQEIKRIRDLSLNKVEQECRQQVKLAL
jgi:hypothetical protein